MLWLKVQKLFVANWRNKNARKTMRWLGCSSEASEIPIKNQLVGIRLAFQKIEIQATRLHILRQQL